MSRNGPIAYHYSGSGCRACDCRCHIYAVVGGIEDIAIEIAVLRESGDVLRCDTQLTARREDACYGRSGSGEVIYGKFVGCRLLYARLSINSLVVGLGDLDGGIGRIPF